MKLASTALMIAALVGSAAAQGTLLYVPVKLISDQGISVKGWGSGTIAETDETAYEGVRSLRISSRNYFQGGVITYANPVDLSSEFGDKANLMRIVFKAPESATVTGGGTSGGRPGGRPGTGGGDEAGVMGPGAGGRPGAGAPAGAASPLQNLRVIVTTTDGKKSEAYVPVNTSRGGTNGWVTAAIPLQAIAGFDRTNKIIKSIAFAPDTTTTMYIGELRVVEDTTPIRGEASPSSLNLGANQEVNLTAWGTGGASILKYSWDFDETDGIQEDATGPSVTRKFRKPGTFTITLTISDYFGLKAPYQTKIKAVVNG